MQVNSIAVGDNFMASSDYKRNRRRLQETGVQLYEFQGANSSHGKSGLIDEEFAFVGSYNLDMRSTYVDTEAVELTAEKKLIFAITFRLFQLIRFLI